MKRANDFIYIDTASQLADICLKLAHSDWFALDTEFIRERTYYPKLCLLQIGTAELTVCVDPLALDDLSPLLTLIYSPQITKIFHASHQDLEIFFLLQGKIPTPIFDTQLAAPLLGYPSQAAYGTLVNTLLDVQLDKAHARADWSKRPLSQQQLEYAADDVRYLGPLYLKLKNELEERCRLNWTDDDFNELSKLSRYNNLPENAWQRIKSARHLNGGKLITLQALAAWREITAQKKNLPRSWLIKDEILTEIARAAPTTLNELSTLPNISEANLARHGKAIIDTVNTSLNSELDNGTARLPQHIELTAQQKSLVASLMKMLLACAQANNLQPGSLASRKDIEQLLKGNQDINLLKGWRYDIAGEKILAAIKSENN